MDINANSWAIRMRVNMIHTISSGDFSFIDKAAKSRRFRGSSKNSRLRL